MIQCQISAGIVATGVVMIGRVSHAARRRSASETRDSVVTPWSGGASHADLTIVMAVSYGMVRGAPAPTSSVLSPGILKRLLVQRYTGTLDTPQRHVLTSQTRNLQSTKHAKNISKRTLTFMTHTFVTSQFRPVSNPL